MINLLPRDLARQLAFAKANAKLLHYVQLATLVSLVLAGIFAGTIFYMMQQAATVERSLAEAEAEIKKYAGFEKEAMGIAERLEAIKMLEADQTRFSLLLSDLAQALPRSVALKGITLTGDHTKPVRITITAPTYETAVAARNPITQSPRIAAADLESVGAATTGGYEATVTIAFKPGQAR